MQKEEVNLFHYKWGKRRRKKISGTAVRVRSSRGSINYMINAKVCISVYFLNLPTGGG